MKITAIQIENIKGFQKVPKTALSNGINIFIGTNNSGKSTILNCIFLLQRNVFHGSDVTIGKSQGQIDLFLGGDREKFLGQHNGKNDKISIRLYSENHSNHKFFIDPVGRETQTKIELISSVEPHNLIYPYLSKRKVGSYIQQIDEANAHNVSGDFSNLYSKIDKLMNRYYQPAHNEYIKACEDILGFVVSTDTKGSGKQAVYFIYKRENIPLTAMGEGVPNILGLIIDLCVAEDKIFLIEEPENDIHPKALKALLKLIIEKSSNNQFFISTHSNIVMKYLGSIPNSKIFNVSNDTRDIVRQNLFISNLTEVPNEPEERRKVLEDLGYDFFDFDLWKGWLFLEESSAEVIIRDYLIEWFVEPLKNQIRTFSAGGTSKIETKFEDFDRLFVFLHLEPTYKNKVWVIIDAGEVEGEIINKMKLKYTQAGWNEANFAQFKERDFERYYPFEFQERVAEVINIPDKEKRRTAKKALLDEVKAWIGQEGTIAKDEFSKSASEVIEYLQQIKKQLNA